ncbi:immunoglobulin-like domain-containing protein [Polaribacter sp.]|uniref:immunoglobulin-like domain-containing protein n=1 Tax=Polaribacter sp. TaxID=1920175 RepID=UPI0025E41D8D|nr:immunoglobulin-like domain-containing protein [Polaribacter sp.]
MNGSSASYITFKPYQNEEVIIEFDGIYGFLIQNSSYIKIENFIFDGVADNITQNEAEDAWGLYKDTNGVIHDLEAEMGIDITDPSIIGTSINQPATSDETIIKPIKYNGIALVANTSHHIELIGNTIRNVPSMAIRAKNSDYLTITSNKVYNNTFWTTQSEGAITVIEAEVRPLGDTYSGTKIIITQNEVYQNENRLISWNPTETFVHFEIDEGKGIFLTRNKDSYTHGEMLIANNLSYKNGASGIVCHHTNDVVIEHNTVFDNGTTNHGDPGGIGVNSSDNVKILGNISYSKPNKWALGILAEPVTNLTLDSNIVFNNSGSTGVIRNTSTNSMVTGFIETDPLFLDSENHNFSLKLESPSVNQVNNDQTISTHDYYGVVRDSSPDIGAIEYLSPFYVDPTNGDDDTADGTRDLPYRNIDVAVEEAANAKRNSIYIVEGIHYVETTQTITTQSIRELIIEGEPNKEVVLLWNRLTGIIFRDENTSNPQLDNFPRNITIQNLHFEGRADKKDHYSLLAEHVWFQTDDFKSNIRGCATAINIFEGVDIRIDNNIFRNFWQKAVNIKDGRYVTVSNNIVSEIGLTSLTGGVGISREQWYGSFDDDDDPNKFRWDIRNNLIFNVYQRIYSWVEAKGYYNMVIDEGKPIAINETPDHELGMKARIHNNLIAFTTIDAMVFKSTVNLTISNNSIYTDEEYADAFTDRDKTPARYADDFPGFVFKNNIAHTRDRSDDGVRPLRAIELEDAYGSTNVTIENNFAYGGDIRPKGNPTIVLEGVAEHLESPPFMDPNNGDFSLTAGVPSNAGANLDELDTLFIKAESADIPTSKLDWSYDHIKSVQTLMDNIPGLYDDINDNETIFTTRGIYDISDKEGDRGRKSFYLIPNQEFVERENISSNNLLRPHLPEYNGYYELILNPKYSQWYDEILTSHKDIGESGEIDYPYIRNGSSVIRQDFIFPSDGVTVFELNENEDYDITYSTNSIKIDGDLIVLVNYDIVNANKEFDIIVSNIDIASDHQDLFKNIKIEGNSNPYRLEIIENSDDKILRLTLNFSDTMVPVITLVGDNPMTIEVGSTFTDPGATALDAGDDDLTSSIVVTGSVDTSTIGTYTVTYNVSDANGNAADSVTRTVNVVDTTVPVITLAGDATVDIEVGSTYTDQGATASDNYDGDITSSIVTVNPVDTDVVGQYTVTYNVSDTNSNAAVEVTRTVNVVVSLSIVDNDEIKLSIFPNPTSTSWHIKTKTIINSILLYDILGRKVYFDTPNNKDVQINAKSLPNGFYLLVINKTESFKLIKK